MTTPTSLLRALPSIATCALCGQEQATRVFDPELNGRLCPACAPHVLDADCLLNSMPWIIDRPLPFSSRQ